LSAIGDIQLMPQRLEAADLTMRSKLGEMLAVGTEKSGTRIAIFVMPWSKPESASDKWPLRQCGADQELKIN
jgi:hypothetical protein